MADIPILYKTGDYSFIHEIKKPEDQWAVKNVAEYYDLTQFAEILVSLYDSKGVEVKFSTIEKEGYNLLTFVTDYQLEVVLSSEILALLEVGNISVIGKTKLTDAQLADGFKDSPTRQAILFKLESSKL